MHRHNTIRICVCVTKTTLPVQRCILFRVNSIASINLGDVKYEICWQAKYR